jgi:hypothetical protein
MVLPLQMATDKRPAQLGNRHTGRGVDRARVEAARSICTSLYPTTCVSRTRRGCRCYVHRQDVSIASLLPYLWGKIGHYAEVASFRVVVRKQPGMLPLINGAGASAIGDPASKSISTS